MMKCVAFECVSIEVRVRDYVFPERLAVALRKRAPVTGTRGLVSSQIGESRSIARGMRATDSPRDGTRAEFPLPRRLRQPPMMILSRGGSAGARDASRPRESRLG